MTCISCAGAALDRGGMTLTRRESSPIPVEADSICPDRFIGLNEADIARLPAFYGRRPVTLGDLFEIYGVGATDITVTGDLAAVKKIGYGMTMGRVTVEGPVGQHTGARMTGGELVVRGDAGDWLGAYMAGGRIVVEGNAGHFVGGAYSGDTKGMRGGTILVKGDVGREAGGRMRRGLIIVLGDTGEFTAARMLAGTVFVRGRLGARAGAGMKRGTVVAFGEVAELLPTFRYTCTYRPVFIRYYLRRLRETGLVAEGELEGELFRRSIGDLTNGGRGEVLVRAERE